MRNFCYWVCFILVAFSSLFSYGSWLLYVLGVRVPYLGLFSLFTSFGSLIPVMFAPLLPRFVGFALGLVMLVLVCRRVWLLAVKRQGVPQSFTGFPKVVGYIGAWSFLLALIGLLLSMLLRAGSGVPAGMLAIPAIFCVPWAFFLSEVFSFRRAKANAV
ncbi:hypothetical protein FACS1894116_07850 [Betaproteobacteria bacterium]|nr:hypothetical protein FACS1894116_07850 [Betaproteobacteria bacterium]GHU30171.1 hypothetical protein FACS189497_09510 [Betaproteobacteria bacterium]